MHVEVPQALITELPNLGIRLFPQDFAVANVSVNSKEPDQIAQICKFYMIWT